MVRGYSVVCNLLYCLHNGEKRSVRHFRSEVRSGVSRGTPGNWRSAPENSVAAIDSAIQMGVDIVEIDIHKTKDGQLILMHDDRVDRTTNGKGLIKDYTLAEIKKLKLKDKDGNLTEHIVPTLEEALLAGKGQIMFNWIRRILCLTRYTLCSRKPELPVW